MDWERIAVLRVSQRNEETQRYPLLIAARFLRVRGLILASDQIRYRRIGYLRILTLEGDLALSKLVVQDSEIIPIPEWLPLFRVEFVPLNWIYNAQVILDRALSSFPVQPGDENEQNTDFDGDGWIEGLLTNGEDLDGGEY
ncbi:hypothetical protein NIES2104_56800 [Leptolyngbya sp. NIES-2104]|nr:hypothetical protein NIES2104_56800 [Leptolyngbya sp. NIES-2104]